MKICIRSLVVLQVAVLLLLSSTVGSLASGFVESQSLSGEVSFHQLAAEEYQSVPENDDHLLAVSDLRSDADSPFFTPIPSKLYCGVGICLALMPSLLPFVRDSSWYIFAKVPQSEFLEFLPSLVPPPPKTVA